jgi:hypothetical protein
VASGNENMRLRTQENAPGSVQKREA